MDQWKYQLERIIGSLVRGRLIRGFHPQDSGDLQELGVEYVKWLALNISPGASESLPTEEQNTEIGQLSNKLDLINSHNEAKWQLLHEAYQAGLLDPNEYLKKRAYKLLGGVLPDVQSPLK